MTKKIIIIGAGIAGLSTGCYGQMNGYDTEIYEMHNKPGGLCTAWERKGYTFDGCIHWLMGAKQGTSMNKYWNEIGALDGRQFINHDLHMQIEDRSGKKLALCADVDKLESQLLELSPADEDLIRELTRAIRKFASMEMPMDKPQDMYGFLDMAKMMIKMGSKMKDFADLNKISIGQFSDKFKDPFLREAIPGIMPRDYSLFVLIMVLSTYANKDAGWPMGGSFEFAKDLEKSYMNKGGKIHYRSKVESILVKDDKAVGIRLADGSEHYSDYVVSAADGFATIFKMLDGKYTDENILSLYNEVPLSPTSVQVSLGVDCDLSQEPYAISVKLEKPFKVGNTETSYFNFRHYCYDSSMAPAGKSTVTSILGSDYGYWEQLYKDKEAYSAQKKTIADEFIKVFEERFPYAKGKVEVVDVSTPYTYNRYTGTWKGVYMSWLTTPERPMLKVPGKLPGLGSFYMAGQWANPSGGVPIGVVTGRWSLMRICKDDGRKFTAGSN